jgi:hypothetical protein
MDSTPSQCPCRGGTELCLDHAGRRAHVFVPESVSWLHYSPKRHAWEFVCLACGFRDRKPQ